jgi:hypothetical protein
MRCSAGAGFTGFGATGCRKRDHAARGRPPRAGAVVIAWLLLGEAITPTQAMGGAVVLLGLALAGCEDREPADVVARASWPDAGPVTVESPRSEQAIGIR